MTSLIGNQGYRGNATGMGNRPGAGTGSVIPKGYDQARINQFTPQQHQLYSDMFQHVDPQSFLSQIAGGDENAFSQMEAPALKQFAGIQGNIASRFSGLGLGGRKSSGFQNTMNQAGSDFASQLQSNRLGLMRQAQQDLFGLSNQLLNQRPYENMLVEKPKKWWEDALSGLGGAVTGAGAGYFGSKGNPWMAGAGAFQGFGSGYGGGR